MFPIGDHAPSGKFPFMTYFLVAANVIIFAYMLLLPELNFERFLASYSLIPAVVSHGHRYYTLVTSMFLHGSIAHILVNMLFLRIFGDNLEYKLGHLKFLFFYLVSGIGASLLQLAFIPESLIPNLGASGAIAGVMGGYLLLFPTRKVDLLMPWLMVLPLPAVIVIVYWIGLQYFLGFAGLVNPADAAGVAYFAHIGGFLTGFLLILPFVRKLNHRRAITSASS